MQKECFNCKDISLEMSEMIDFLKIISEENRLKTVCFLKNKERCVCEIQEFLDIPQNLISHHLRVMKYFNLLKSNKVGLKVFYSLNKDIIKKYSSLLNSFLSIK